MGNTTVVDSNLVMSMIILNVQDFPDWMKKQDIVYAPEEKTTST